MEDGESEAEGGSGSQRKQKRGQTWNLAKRVINTAIHLSRTLSRHRNKSPPWGWPFFGAIRRGPVVFPALTDVRLNTPRYALELDDRSFVTLAPRKRSVSPLDLKQWLCFKT